MKVDDIVTDKYKETYRVQIQVHVGKLRCKCEHIVDGFEVVIQWPAFITNF